MTEYWNAFVELIRTPFAHESLVWGIVPLYFGLLVNEMTSAKASYQTAVQTGFSFLWASAQWFYPYFRPNAHGLARLELGAMMPVNLCVTSLVFGFGVIALISGLRKKYPPHCAFLGYTRFANYFMIAIFPIQARVIAWSWDRLIAIGIFAVPVWLVLHFGLMPIRNRK